MNELVSVIVPVYNIEAYLPRCLECIKAQSYTNLEIILVDDGSTDSSGKICDEYAVSDSRARVIHHDHNIGLWAARNTGQDAATGEYLWFPDGDDYFHRDIVKIMYEAINLTNVDGNKYDLAIVNYRQTTKSDENTEENTIPSFVDKTIDELFENMDFHMKKCISNSMWGKFFRTELIKDIHSDNYQYAQDRDFSIRVYFKEPRVIFIENELYWWVQRSSSQMGRADYSFIHEQCTTRMYYKNYMAINDMNKSYSRHILFSVYLHIANWLMLAQGTESITAVRQEIRQIVKHTWRQYLNIVTIYSPSKRVMRLLRIRFDRLYVVWLKIIQR